MSGVSVLAKAGETFRRLDALSRTRILTNRESIELERALAVIDAREPPAASKPSYYDQRTGEIPSRRAGGCIEEGPEVAASLTEWWRDLFLSLPDGDFPRSKKMRAKIHDSMLRRGFIERCGYCRDGQWQYRLTSYGRAIRDAISYPTPNGEEQ